MMTQESELTHLEGADNDRSLLKSRLTLLGLIATFLVPLGLAMFLYVRLDVWKPDVYVNHGELMQPVQPLSFLQATGESGPLALESLNDKWTLLYLGEGDCSIQCQSQLFKMRQSRAMLGRDLVRVQTLYIALDSAANEGFHAVRAEYPVMQAGVVDAAYAMKQKQAFSSGQVGEFFLLDPHGNLVLKYDREATTKGVVKDLKRLLKVSNIG